MHVYYYKILCTLSDGSVATIDTRGLNSNNFISSKFSIISNNTIDNNLYIKKVIMLSDKMFLCISNIKNGSITIQEKVLLYGILQNNKEILWNIVESNNNNYYQLSTMTTIKFDKNITHSACLIYLDL